MDDKADGAPLQGWTSTGEGRDRPNSGELGENDTRRYLPLSTPLPGQEVIETREKAHGDYTKQASFAQSLKFLVRQQPSWLQMTGPQRESVEMIIVKLSRILNGDANEADHWRDIAGYATLITNLLTRGTHL